MCKLFGFRKMLAQYLPSSLMPFKRQYYILSAICHKCARQWDLDIVVVPGEMVPKTMDCLLQSGVEDIMDKIQEP